MIAFSPLVALALAPAFGSSPAASDGGLTAVQAGTIHLVDADTVLEDGTVLIRDGKIVAVGVDLDVPATARVVDYGPDAVIVPGLVAAASAVGSSRGGRRTAEPDLLAIDGFDPYTPYYNALNGGVTTVYLAPARNRLIAGQGAVVKAAGAAGPERVLAERSALHGSVSAEARSTPGYWDPPVPATVDVGIGLEQRQLPRTTMGAVVALEELLQLARNPQAADLAEIYGPGTGPGLRALMDEGRAWRMGAQSASEVRAVLEFFAANELPLVIEGASGAPELAQAIAEAGVAVIAAPPHAGGADFGKTADSRWPEHGVIAKLVEAGVKVAITCPDSAPLEDLFFYAGIASRGGLSARDALRAVTIDAAEVLGVADRVGSLAVGKDADFAVLSGSPFVSTTAVMTTWCSGEVAWKSRSLESAAVVLEVEELHLGDGQTLAPGQLLMRDGEIVEVGRRVSHPAGSTVVRGFAAMPGMIDALGHLGLEGAKDKFSARVKLERIVEPGDFADRRVAQAGVTTVNLASRAKPGGGSGTMAYKPAGEEFDRMVVASNNAVRMEWTNDIRSSSGEQVLKTLAKAKKYVEAWDAYEKEAAEWKPPVEESDDEESDDDDEDEDEAEEDDDEDEDDKKSSRKRKKKKKGDKEPRIATGVWQNDVDSALATGPARFRLQLVDEAGTLHGSLRCADLSDDLIDVEGTLADDKVLLTGLGTRGRISVELEWTDDGLAGSARVGEIEIPVEIEQSSKVYRIAERPERRREEPVKEPKGKPKPPGEDSEMEVLRRAMRGEATVIVNVEREDEILDCVKAFESFGIQPVLFGAARANRVAKQIAGRVRGVLLARKVKVYDRKKGLHPRNPYAELSGAGIPVAFHSGAEEGAVELPLFASYAVANGMSPASALRALTGDAATMLSIDDRVGLLRAGMDGDVLLLDGAPLAPATEVLRVWVSAKEIR